MPMEGLEQIETMRKAGFSEQEIGAWANEQKAQLQAAGFTDDDLHSYFGTQPFDKAGLSASIAKNMAAAHEAETKDGKAPKEAKGFIDAVEAGLQMSVTGLGVRREKPNMVLPEHAPMFHRIASSAATLAGDFPFMVAGAIGGAAAGSTVAPGPGTLIGAGAGGGALPEFLRASMMQAYEKGEVKDFSDFWERASAVMIDTSKAGAVGAVTMGVGGKVAKVAVPALGPVAGRMAQATSEVATMTTMGKALEGEMPTAEDFAEGAILVAGMHGATKIGKKALGKRFVKTGEHPAEIAAEMERDPVLKHEILTSTDDSRPTPKAVDAKIAELKTAQPEAEGAKIEAPKEAPKTAEDKISARIETPKDPTVIEKAKEFVKDAKDWNQHYTNFVDKLNPLKTAVETLTSDKVETVKDPYKLARMVSDAPAKVKAIFERGTIDYNSLEFNGKSLKEIIAPHEKDYVGFRNFLVAARALEIAKSGRETGFDLAAAKEVVANGKETYGASAKEFTEFNNRMMKYLSDAGVVSEEAFASMKEHGEFYVSFKRILEDGNTSSSGKGKPSNLKRLKGSDLKIQDPLLSTLENTEAIVRMAEKNRAARALVELAEKSEGQEIVKKVKTKMAPLDITEAVEKFGGEPGEDVSIFRPVKKALSKNEIEVFRNGKREVWEVADQGIADALKGLDPPSSNIFFKLASGVTAIKKIGITLTPDFILKNAIRDQITSGVFTKGGSVPFVDVVTAMGDLVKKNDNYYNWMKAGGANGAFIELNNNYLKNDFLKHSQELGLIEKSWNVAKKPLDFVVAAGHIIESAPRLAEFKRVSKGATGGTKVFEGGFASREVTLDFQRVGAKMSALNSITAFMNVSIQGLDKTARAVKDNPAGVGMKSIAYITVPSVLLWWANKDDPRYQQVPRWQKDLFWIIPTDKWEDATPDDFKGYVPEYLQRRGPNGQLQINNGKIIRIPKPQELGIVFGSLPERVLEKYFHENPRAMKDFEETMFDMVTPSVVPDIATPFVEQSFNKRLFTGGKLIPTHLEEVVGDQQYTTYTSETAKALGRLGAKVPGARYSRDPLGRAVTSPIVIENYIRSWSGNLGDYALRIADQALISTGAVNDPVKPAQKMEEWPMIRAFHVRFPQTSPQAINDFSERMKVSDSVKKTIDLYKKRQDFAGLQKDLGDEDFLAHSIERADGIQTAITKARQTAEKIYINPTIPPHEKRQLIDGFYMMMNEMAVEGNKVIDSIEQEMKRKK